jgi:hypothetical protein
MATTGALVEQLRTKITRYHAPLGEQNTKAALIEPLLRALGWDVEDVDEVHREYKARAMDNPVDYALMLERKPVLFVEAKGTRENLEDRKWAAQIMSYAVVAGVEWVLLTNGDEYRIYNSHAAVPVQDKLFRSARLSEPRPRSKRCSILCRGRASSMGASLQCGERIWSITRCAMHSRRCLHRVSPIRLWCA